MDLTPTTSVTLTQVVGDCLAIALMQQRGFQPEDFRYLHPGGVIGRSASRRARELMHGGGALPRVREGTRLRVVMLEIMDKRLGITAVLEADGSLAGVVSDGDSKRILLKHADPWALTAADVMTRTPTAIGPDELVASADYWNPREAVNTYNASHEFTKKGLALTPVKFGISFTTTFLNQAACTSHRTSRASRPASATSLTVVGRTDAGGCRHEIDSIWRTWPRAGGLIDGKGGVRDLSQMIGDLDGPSLSRRNLERLRALEVEGLPRVETPGRYGACVAKPGKFVCVGLNYRDHAAETGALIPTEPVLFMKATSAVSGPNDPLIMPRNATKLDW